MGNVKYKIVSFNGSRNQGSDVYWIAFYNENHNHQSDGLQLFFSFSDGKMRYGVCRYLDNTYLSDYIYDGDIDELLRFVENNKTIILNDNKRTIDIILDEVKNIFQNNGNIALSINDINNRLNNRIDKNRLSEEVITSNLYDVIDGENSLKFKLKNYMPSKVKELFENNGFITIDILRDIFERNNININI